MKTKAMCVPFWAYLMFPTRSDCDEAVVEIMAAGYEKLILSVGHNSIQFDSNATATMIKEALLCPSV